MAGILSVKDAQNIILHQFSVLSEEWVELRQAGSRVLSRDIWADADMPAFTNSAMDGYAVRASDTIHASPTRPTRLTVIGDLPAGRAADFHLSSGQAARIMTGAPLPDGADAVVPVEDTDAYPGPNQALPEQISILTEVATGAFLRPQGQDVRRGQLVLQRGHKLNPRDIGMLAALGNGSVPVVRKPKIALLSTGSELVAPSHRTLPGEVYDSNSYTLAAQIEATGGEVVELGIARDSADEVRNRLDEAVRQHSDLIITSAGVSVGAFDFVRHIIEAHGSLNFWRVNMRPGKPLAFGKYRGVPIVGLPGNPVSAYIGMLVFIIPVIRRLAGLSAAQPPRRQARLTEPITSDGRESYLRAIAHLDENGRLNVKLAGNQSSGNLYSLILANALLIVPSGVKSLPIDTQVEIWLLVDEIE